MQPLGTKKMMHPLGTQKKSRKLSGQKNNTTSRDIKKSRNFMGQKITNLLGQNKTTQPLGTKNDATSWDTSPLTWSH